MVLNRDEKQDIREQLDDRDRYILEKMSSDRKAHSIYSQHINTELAEIKAILKDHLINDDIHRMQLEQVSKKAETINNVMAENAEFYKKQISDIKTDITEHKNKAWVIEWLYDHKKTTFTIIAIFVFTFIDKIIQIYQLLKIKMLG